jgi:hypothetical protein
LRRQHAAAVACIRRAIRVPGPHEQGALVSDPRGAFVMNDLYLTVWGTAGVVRAHGSSQGMVGKNLIDLKDIDGKPFIR